MKPPELKQFFLNVYNHKLYDFLPCDPGLVIRNIWREKYENFESVLRSTGIFISMEGNEFRFTATYLYGHNSENDCLDLPEEILPSFFDFVDFIFGTLPPKSAVSSCFMRCCEKLRTIRQHAEENRKKEIEIQAEEVRVVLRPYKVLFFESAHQ